MKILFYNPQDPRMSIEDAQKKPLRGAQKAFLYLSALVADKFPGDVDIVFKEESIPAKRYDVAVFFRQLVGAREVESNRKVFWSQNPWKGPDARKHNEDINSGMINAVIVETEYHKRTFQARGVARGKEAFFWTIDNGVEPIPESAVHQKKEKLFLYASAPHRGMQHLAAMWPRIKKALPEYSLAIAGGTALYSAGSQAEKKFLEKMKKSEDQLESMPGVQILKGLTSEEYFALMGTAEALLYPCATLEETSCIVVHEALLLGCVPVVSEAGALPEVVRNRRDGFVVKGMPIRLKKDPDDFRVKKFCKRFEKTVIRAARWNSFEKIRKKKNKYDFSWESKAKQFIEYAKKAVEEKQKGTE